MAELPSDDELDAMAMKLTGYGFDAQPGPHEKARIMELCNQNQMAADLNRLAQVDDHLDRIDDSLRDIANWFEKSRLWEGEVWNRG